MIAGEYTVYVNYAVGSGPSTMTLIVLAGNEYFTKTMVLPNQGSTQICKIVATLNPSTGSYTYQIIS